MDESRIGQYSISVTTYPIMALIPPYERFIAQIYQFSIGSQFEGF